MADSSTQVYFASSALQYRVGNSGGAISGTIGSISSGAVMGVGTSANNFTSYGYIDGIPQSSRSISGIPASSNVINMSLGHRWQSYPTTGFSSEPFTCYLSLTFNDFLSPGEHILLNSNPWDIFLSPVNLLLNRAAVAAPSGRVMSSLANYGGLVGHGGLAGQRGGLAG